MNLTSLLRGKGILQCSLYGKKMWESGVFFAVDTGYGKTKNSVNLSGDTVHLKRNVFEVSAHLGREWDIHNFNLKPSIGMRYYHLSEANYNAAGTNVSTKPVNMLSTQVGISINRKFNFQGVEFTPELGIYYVDVSQGKLNTEIANQRISQKIGRCMNQELGVSAQYRNFNLGLQVGFMQGNMLKKQNAVSLKMMYEW